MWKSEVSESAKSYLAIRHALTTAKGRDTAFTPFLREEHGEFLTPHFRHAAERTRSLNLGLLVFLSLGCSYLDDHWTEHRRPRENAPMQETGNFARLLWPPVSNRTSSFSAL